MMMVPCCTSNDNCNSGGSGNCYDGEYGTVLLGDDNGDDGTGSFSDNSTVTVVNIYS